MRRRGLVVSLLLTLGLSVSAVTLLWAADPEPKVAPREPERIDVNRIDNPELVSQINLARRLMNSGNYDGASAILEVAYEKYPADQRLFNQLRLCYLSLRYFEKLEAITRRFIELYPKVVQYRIFLGEVFAGEGRRDSAEAAYVVAAATVPDSDREGLRDIVRSMNAVGMWDAAVALVDSLRRRTADTILAALEKGQSLESLKDYGGAAREYFTVLGDTSRDATTAEKKLLDMLEFEGATEPVQAVLLEQSEKVCEIRALKILSTHFLRTDQFEKAFRFAILEDSLEGQAGGRLLSFMNDCHDRGLYDEAVALGEYVQRHYADSAVMEEAWFLHADALANLGRYDEAIAMYDTVAARFPQTADKAVALYRIGQIYGERKYDYAKALVYYDSVIADYPSGQGFLYSQLARPYCFLRRGDLESAYREFYNLLSRRLTDDMREEVEYHVALVQFYQKRVDSARLGLNHVMVKFPRGYYFNDAVRLLLIMDKVADSSELLYDYSNALLFEDRRMPDSAESRYVQIAGAVDQSLADIALYRLALLSLDRGKADAALKYLEQLVERFPDSYYRPYGMKAQADILVENPMTVDDARVIYRELLEKYAGFPFASQVREKLRELEVDARIG